MNRITKVLGNGEYSVEPNRIYDMIRKLGKIEDRIEREERGYIEVSYEETKEEVYQNEV